DRKSALLARSAADKATTETNNVKEELRKTVRTLEKIRAILDRYTIEAKKILDMAAKGRQARPRNPKLEATTVEENNPPSAETDTEFAQEWLNQLNQKKEQYSVLRSQLTNYEKSINQIEQDAKEISLNVSHRDLHTTQSTIAVPNDTPLTTVPPA